MYISKKYTILEQEQLCIFIYVNIKTYRMLMYVTQNPLQNGSLTRHDQYPL